MKATQFAKPFEFNLHVEGESWRQGDPVSGCLTVRNRGAEPAQTQGVRVELAYGSLRKVRAKAPGAFNTIAGVTLPQTPESTLLAPGAEARLDWEFRTEVNCPISDSGASLFLLYGSGEVQQLGQLQLTVVPHAWIEEIQKVLEVQFRFVRKTRKARKGAVEIKYAPPASRGFALVEQLVVTASFENDGDLALEFEFQVKSLSAPSIKSFQQRLGPAQMMTPSGRFRFEEIEARIGEVLAQMDSKLVF